MYYILIGREAVPANLMTWARWFEAIGDARIIEQEYVGTTKISTVFLGLDHSWNGNPPLIFETLVFGGPLDDKMDRCTTYDQAEAMHATMVAQVEVAQGQTDSAVLGLSYKGKK